MADKGLMQNAEGETPGKEQYMIYLLENTDKLDESFIKKQNRISVSSALKE